MQVLRGCGIRGILQSPLFCEFFCSFLGESKLQPELKTGSYVRYQQLLASGMWSKLPIWKPRVRRAVVSSGCGFGLVARKEKSNGERVLIYS